MTYYKGYYIDGFTFTSKNEIDAFIKEQAISRYKMLCVMFDKKPSMELSAIMADHAEYMHNVCGMAYSEIEEIEISAFAAA